MVTAYKGLNQEISRLMVFNEHSDGENVRVSNF